jgi:hypothetical protein
VAQSTDESELLEDELGLGKMAGLVLLVVNTMGWMKGLVWDLDRHIEGIFGPGFVFEVNEPHHYGMAMGIDCECKMSRWMGKTNFGHTKNTCSSRSIPEERYKIDRLRLIID